MTAIPKKIIDYASKIPDHDPVLYRPASTVPTVKTLDDVGQAEADFYADHGYVAVEQALSPEEVRGSIRAIDELVAGRRAGEFKTMYEAGVDPETLGEQERIDAVRKLAFFSNGHALPCQLPIEHPGMMRVVQLLMGGRRPRPFQIMTLLKPPKIGREKPWHQDHAYFNLHVDDRIVGIWIALDEATVENGCMQLLDGGHKLGPIHHWKRRDWQICDAEVMGKPSVAAPLPRGGALFFDSLLPHGTPTNRSPQRRRAMQFHYAPAGGRQVSSEDRMAIFGTEGKDVEC